MQRLVHPADHLLVLAIDRELAPQRQSWVDAHLSQCRACRDRLARLQSTLADVRCVCQASPEPDGGVAAASRRRLQAALRTAAQQELSPWSRRLRRLVPAALDTSAMAAAALVGVFLLWSHAGDGGLTMTTWTRSGTLPVATLTPGVVSPLTAAQLCAGERPSRLVNEDVRLRVLRSYGMEVAAPEQYELDALITPELGGTTDPENLWPQLYTSLLWSAHIKDALEQRLAEQVCRHEITLAQAQRDIAVDWIAAYRRSFATNRPLPEHAASVAPDDDLIFEGSVPAHVMTRLFEMRPPMLSAAGWRWIVSRRGGVHPAPAS